MSTIYSVSPPGTLSDTKRILQAVFHILPLFLRLSKFLLLVFRPKFFVRGNPVLPPDYIPCLLHRFRGFIFGNYSPIFPLLRWFVPN